MPEQRLEEIRKIRIDRVKKLREMGINPYPSKAKGDRVIISDALNSYGSHVAVVGRLMRLREHGNVIFADIKDESGQIQLWFQKNSLGERFKTLKLFDVGDFLFAEGNITKTSTDEISVDVANFLLLTKSIRPLPSLWYGLKDEEERYRKRYLDLLLNDDLKDIFRKKALFWQSMRDFMIKKGFLEVETPVLEATAGGADANPFVTHHEALDTDFYLRISMGELWQKRLMVAGFEKTFEIGRQFRNEGLSREHLQDYSQMEFYWAYANYEDSMNLVEEMYKHVAQSSFGKLQFTIMGMDVDLGKKWDRIDYRSTVLEHTGVDVSKVAKEELVNKLKELKADFDIKEPKERLIDNLWKTVRKKIAGPAFLVGHPVSISPLSKRMEENPELVERYQVILAGSEMGNGYSELNDPIDQAERFADQQKLRDEGDAEAQMHDRDFVEALEYGMPPVTGFGVSERLFSFLADKSIREAVLFPLLKPEFKKIGKKALTGKDISSENELPDENEYKFYAVIRKDIEVGKAMNALGHASVGLGGGSGYADKMWFLKYKDKDGGVHPNISHYNYVVLKADSSEQIRKVRQEAIKKNVIYADFTGTMTLGKSIDQMRATENTPESELDYFGVVLFGKTKDLKSFTANLSLFK